MLNRRYITFACFVGFIVLGIFNSQLGPTLPSVAAAVALPLASAGIFRTARQIGILSGVLGGGRILDKQDARLVFGGGAFLTVAGLLGMITASRVEFMLAASLIMGIGSGMLDVGPNYVIPAIHTTNASSMLMLLHTFVGIGAAAGPLITAWAIEQRGDWRIAYIVTAIIVAGMGIVFMGMRINTRRQRIAHQEQKAADPTPRAEAEPVQWGPLVPLILLIFLYNGAGTGVADWIYTHLQLVANADVNAASQITSLFWAALTGGRLLTIPVLRRFGEIPTLIGALVIATIGAILIVAAGANVPLIALGVVLVSAGFSPIFPTVIALGGQQQPQARGTVTGTLGAFAAFGGMTIPVLQGWIGGGHNGGMIVPVVASVIMLVTVVIYFRMYTARA
jgi:fucose permease